MLAGMAIVVGCVQNQLPEAPMEPPASYAPDITLPEPFTPPPATAETSSGVSYAKDVQPFTSSKTCKTCHQGGGAPELALGSYGVDSSVSAKTLRTMLSKYGKLSADQLAKVDSWIQANRPEAPLAASPAPAASSPSPSPSPSPVLTPSPTASATLPPAESLRYSVDIQPLTSSQTCKGCHQGGGSAPQLSLGTFSVDSSANSTTMRRMLVTYGKATATQLATFDAWVLAGRPETGLKPSVAPSTAASSEPIGFKSPHSFGWYLTHRLVVKMAGGYKNAKIGTGQTCTTCHTAEKAADGTLPKSPGSDLTCFSCHNGPSP